MTQHNLELAVENQHRGVGITPEKFGLFICNQQRQLPDDDVM